MSAINQLYLKFGKKNCGFIILYLILVLIIFPLQGILIPRQTTKMVKSLTENTKEIGGILVSIIVIMIISMVLNSFRESLNIELFPKRLLHHVRKEVYENIIDRYSDDYTQIKTADVIQRINSISRNITFHMDWIMQQGLPYTIALLIINSYLFSKDKKVGLIAFGGFALSGLSTYLYAKAIINNSLEREQVMINQSQDINNSLTNLKNIYINAKQNTNKTKIQKQNEEHSEKLTDELLLGRDMKIIVTVVTLLTFLSVVYYLYISLTKTKTTSEFRFEMGATIAILLTYIGWLKNLFLDMPFVFHRIGILQNSEAFLNDIFAKRENGKVITGINKGNVAFQNVTFTIQNKTIMTDVNYVFDAQRITCLKGQSGSGKSITAQLIIGLFTPQKGKITIDGIDVSHFEKSYLRKNILYINQIDNMFEDTVIFNMMYGIEEDMVENKKIQLRTILKEYGLETLYETIGGIEADVGVNGTNLSTGMKKVIMILRGILKPRPAIYIFDEPTAGLDQSTSTKVINMIKKECKNKTVIIITHSDTVTDLCQKVITVS